MQNDIPPVIQRLRTFKRNPEPRTKGNPNAKLTRAFAEKFCNLISQSDDSVFDIIAANPDFPSFNVLYHWQQRVLWFKDLWQQARIKQTQFLAQQCLRLAKSAEPKTAHVVRIKFDILKWYCAKFNPEIFADKPASAPVQTVNVGFSISPERLTEIRTKLDSSRSAFAPRLSNQSKPGKQSPARLGNGSVQSERNAPKVVYNPNGECSDQGPIP